jgi:hypothetical protein
LQLSLVALSECVGFNVLHSQLRVLVTNSWATSNLPSNILFPEKMTNDHIQAVFTDNPENRTQPRA